GRRDLHLPARQRQRLPELDLGRKLGGGFLALADGAGGGRGEQPLLQGDLSGGGADAAEQLLQRRAPEQIQIAGVLGHALGRDRGGQGQQIPVAAQTREAFGVQGIEGVVTAVGGVEPRLPREGGDKRTGEEQPQRDEERRVGEQREDRDA